MIMDAQNCLNFPLFLSAPQINLRNSFYCHCISGEMFSRTKTIEMFYKILSFYEFVNDDATILVEHRFCYTIPNDNVIIFLIKIGGHILAEHNYKR